ncbi:MAG: hypothetical protein IKU58_01640 [Clostridia bacterium]|nr:hypothetical protein [Clostridia bacterium]
MKYAWKTVIRNWRITLAAVLAVTALTFFLSVFTGSIQNSREQLARIYEVTTVTARVAGYSGGAGASIEEEICRAILDSGFVKDHEALIQNKTARQDILRALSAPRLVPDFEGWVPYITWLDGYDISVLEGQEAVCLAPLSLELELGSTVVVPLGGVYRGQTMELTVVGLYGKEYRSADEEDTYYCPLGAMEVFLRENQQKITYNILEMELQKLDKLGEFKAQMSKLGLEKGSARLTVNDALLQQVTAKFRQHIRLLNTLLPVLLAVVAGIGFGLSFLLLRGRKKEAAVLRSLGTRRRQVFGIFLLESAIQASLGTLLGGLLASGAMGKSAFAPQYLALVLICFLLGGAAAVWQLAKANVFTVMAGE